MGRCGSATGRERFESELMSGVSLTPAEVRILELLPTHLTLAQIAAGMFISRNTAKSQVAAIYRKLSVGNRDEAVRRAREIGLLPAPTDAPAEPAQEDHQARVLAFPSPAAPDEAERDPEARLPPQRPRPAGRIPRPAAQRESLIAGGEGPASPDPLMLLARSSAARSDAREISARAHQAWQVSLRLWTAASQSTPSGATPSSGSSHRERRSGQDPQNTSTVQRGPELSTDRAPTRYEPRTG